MKIVTGINKWYLTDELGQMSDKVFSTQADAEAYGGEQVTKGEWDEAIILAGVSKMILPPVVAIKVDV